ncbi:MAG: DUF1634 domain-containing protein [Thermoplasmata archaeon]
MPAVKPLPLEAYLRMTLVLRVGLGVALAILGVGIVAYTLENPNASSSSVLTSNPILSYLSLEGLASGLASGAVGAFLTLGLIVLVATPIVRVLSGLYYFRQAGERTMTMITFAVFVLLIVGLLAIGPYVR